MNRFLGSLIERHLPPGPGVGGTQVVQPRPKARFEDVVEGPVEPGSVSCVAGASTESGHAPADPDSSHRRIRERASVISQALSPVQRAAPNSSSIKTAVPRADIYLPTTGQPFAAQTRVETEPAQKQRGGKAPFPTEEIGGKTRERSTPAAAAVYEVAAAPVAQSRAVGPGARRPEVEPLTPEPGHGALQPELHDQSRLDGVHANELLSPERLQQLQQQLRTQLPKSGAGEGGEPTINVTIGRVEVRAVSAEKPRQSAGESAPSGIMSLDEYLQQRDGGQP